MSACFKTLKFMNYCLRISNSVCPSPIWRYKNIIISIHFIIYAIAFNIINLVVILNIVFDIYRRSFFIINVTERSYF